jgi:hypothetical protein
MIKPSLPTLPTFPTYLTYLLPTLPTLPTIPTIPTLPTFQICLKHRVQEENLDHTDLLSIQVIAYFSTYLFYQGHHKPCGHTSQY